METFSLVITALFDVQWFELHEGRAYRVLAGHSQSDTLEVIEQLTFGRRLGTCLIIRLVYKGVIITILLIWILIGRCSYLNFLFFVAVTAAPTRLLNCLQIKILGRFTRDFLWLCYIGWRNSRHCFLLSRYVLASRVEAPCYYLDFVLWCCAAVQLHITANEFLLRLRPLLHPHVWWLRPQSDGNGSTPSDLPLLYIDDLLGDWHLVL